MIVYFADRKFNIAGQASTGLPKGLTIKDDQREEDVETGIASFECSIGFDNGTRSLVERCATPGNYILRSDGGENEFYTITEVEIDTEKQEAYIYAEDAGLDLLNEIVGEYAADKAYPIAHYIEKFTYDSGFEIGTNEVSSLTRKLSWDGEATITERLASICTQFDGAEVSYSFKVKGLQVVKKYINIHKKRGKDIGVELRLNRDIDRIITTKSITNLATALLCTGGTPENKENPINLSGYQYDDGDFFTDGRWLKSRKALEQWNRYTLGNGWIVKPFEYDTTDQKTLCNEAIAALKKAREMEVNYEVEISKLPDNARIGDRVNIVDDAGGLYLSARILKLKRSVVNQEHTAVIGEFLIKSSGISQRVADLATKFAQTAQSASRALSVATTASTTATAAKEQANTALADAEKAQQAATEAATAANNATQAAQEAQQKANDAQSAVDGVEKSVEGLQTTIANAEAAAEQARQAAETAETKATEAHTAAVNAGTKADQAAAAAGTAATKADEATTKAETAKSDAEQAKADAEAASTTAAAAKLDAENAQKEINSLGESLTTLSNTMSADYARKTDLTEATASLQTQITQNAAEISSTASRVQTIDETANNAAEQAQAAQTAAGAAQTKADQASADALAAQNAANEATAAANSAQSEADAAKAAAATAKSVADKAEEDLEAAKADLETVTSRVGATEADIVAAQQAVEAAQGAADKAKADAEAAAKKATDAQGTADTAVENAANAQAKANEAAGAAALAQQTADEAKGNASAAQAKADEAAQAAATAQATANTAKTNAENAQAKADQAATDAAAAQKAADDADAKAAQAATDLATAQQNLANVTSRVDATEEEVEAAKQAVSTAQAAADKAKQDAQAAQSTADTAKANATAAQTAASNAKAAADQAQADATAAQQAADKAQGDVDKLAVRVTTAETNITQNTEAIKLTATKKEVVDAIGSVQIGARNLIRNSDSLVYEEYASDKYQEIGSVVTIDAAENEPLEVVSHIALEQAGSGDPSPSNIRPITGHNGITLSRQGKNLFGGEAFADVLVSKGATKEAEKGIIKIQPSLCDYTNLFYTNLKPNTQYTLIVYGSNNTYGGVANLLIRYDDGTYTQVNFADTTVNVDSYGVVTSQAGKTVEGLKILYYGGTTTLHYDKCGLFEGVVSLEDFEPCNVDNFTIDFGQTVYGGTFNWQTGELRISYASIVVDGVTTGNKVVSTDPGAKTYAYFPPLINGSKELGKPKLGGKIYGDRTRCANPNGNVVVVTVYQDLSGVTDSDSVTTVVSKINAVLKSWYDAGTPLTCVYELETPITIQLTPQEILALSGLNYLSSSTGETAVLTDTITASEAVVEGPDGNEDACASLTVNNTPGEFVLAGVASVGSQHTLGFWVRSDVSGSMVVLGDTITTNGTWQKHTKTFTAESEDITLLFETAGTYYLYHTQLEKGNKETDWKPAPEDKASVDDVTEQFRTVTESMADLQVKAGEISGRVTSVEQSTKDSIDSVNDSIQSLTQEVASKMTPEAVEVEIKKAMENGTEKVVTSTGYRFDSEGLTVEKSGSEMKTQITDNGMTVYQNEEKVLEANNVGVDAKNLHAVTYLIVGANSRFEDYGNGRTGCFWIGG